MYVWKGIELRIQIYNLCFCKWASRLINTNLSHPLRPIAYKWVVIRVVSEVGFAMVFKDVVVVVIVPINAIRLDIIDVVIHWMETSGTILDHTKKEHISWAPLTFTMNADCVVVPTLCPLKCIFIDGT
jgi:hypothetical protein